MRHVGIYNALRRVSYLSDANETELVDPIEEEVEEIVEEEILDIEPEENAGLNKAIDTYRKLIEKGDGKEPLTEKQQEELEKRLK